MKRFSIILIISILLKYISQRTTNTEQFNHQLLSIKYFIIKFWINSEISFSKEIINFETKIRVT